MTAGKYVHRKRHLYRQPKRTLGLRSAADNLDLRLKDFRIVHIGRVASGVLSPERRASILGTTSRGVYLSLFAGWVIFLSTERYRGPLTLNVQGSDDVMQPFETGMPVKINERSIDLPGAGKRFYIDQAEIWQVPPALPAAVLPVEQRRKQLMEIIQQLSSKQKNSSFAGLIPELLENKGRASTQSNDLNQRLDNMRMALLERNIADLVNAASAILGLGAGLTPAGDDLIAGLMLVLNRWGSFLAPDLDVEALNQTIIRLAYIKTTRLSANLIECACLGQADERLVLALDGLLTGEPEAGQCAAYLAGWGNTSGLDALAGMALVL